MLHSVTLVLLSILFLQTHFPISDAITEIDAMLARNSLIGEDEELMPSEISRRVLMAQKRYIGYETLRRDMVPCQKPGASYYDCRSGQANSYNRGCETITRCARDTSDITTWLNLEAFWCLCFKRQSKWFLLSFVLLLLCMCLSLWHKNSSMCNPATVWLSMLNYSDLYNIWSFHDIRCLFVGCLWTKLEAFHWNLESSWLFLYTVTEINFSEKD